MTSKTGSDLRDRDRSQVEAKETERAKDRPHVQEMTEEELDAATGGKSTGGGTHSFGGGGGTAFP